MAQAQPAEKNIEERATIAAAWQEKEMKEPSNNHNHNNNNNNNNKNMSSTSSITGGRGHGQGNVPFKFNVQAPEFVPRSHSHGTSATTGAGATAATQMPVSGFFYPCFHYLGATAGTDWFFVGDQDPAAFLISNPNLAALPNCSNKINDVLTDELGQKIIKQVDYQFSDMSLLANESMSKHISKDPEGYVPISVIASTKKMKSLVSNQNLITQALQSSTKLVLSEDGKKVKRKVPFTEKDREELQSRTVVVENLPDDHSHQNLEKIFGVVGSVKNIRICHPQESNSSRSKSDFFLSNKLHALVEFEAQETAEKAVEKLNDERNWRKGLRVRTLLRCSPKSVLKPRKSDFDGIFDDEDGTFPDSSEDPSQPNSGESAIDINAEENSGSAKKGWAKGRGKGRGRGQTCHGGRGLLASCPQSVSSLQCEASSAKHTTSRGPRMPDGTRGFTMGRGKPLAPTPPAALASSVVE